MERQWFQVRSHVSVVDLQHYRMMKAAELASHANCVFVNQDMDAELRYLHNMWTCGPPLQISRQQPGGVHAFLDFAPRYHPQELMRFDLRLIVFERLFGEDEVSSAEAARHACALYRSPLHSQRNEHGTIFFANTPQVACHSPRFCIKCQVRSAAHSCTATCWLHELSFS